MLPHDQTLDDPIAPRAGKPARTVPQLVLAMECARPLAGSARYSLEGSDEVVIGRGAQRAASRAVEHRTRRLSITVPDPRMSSAHGRLRFGGERWVFEDVGSRNGSLVNGAHVGRAVLSDGDTVQLGNTLFFLREHAPLPATEPDDLDASQLDGLPAGHRTIVPAFSHDLATLVRAARSTLSLLLLGETGTGQEVLARSAHAASGVPGAFVAVNCAAIPESLAESQLFGHVKGAFSGAVRDHEGLVAAADGGTLFLDEIGDLPAPAQAKLLRALQEGEVTPVGSTRTRSVRFRVIAATHAPLEQRAARGDFRADLFARLDGFTLRLPALRERREDVGLLVGDLIRKLAPADAGAVTLDAAAGRAILAHDFPHNIRELEQALKRALVLAGPGQISLTHLPPTIAGAEPPAGAPDAGEDDDPLRQTLLAELEKHQGNVSHVAQAMGKARPQVHRWLKRLRIDPSVFRR